MKLFGLILFWVMGLMPVSWAQICGCTDPLANNYNPDATINDGSCNYNTTSISPSLVFELPPILNETSGLIWWNNYLWTHNDDADLHLYALDTLDMQIDTVFSLPDCLNIEWEEISQDDQFIYLGDFGNNSNGNRTDLKILRVDKNSILENNPLVDTIWFSYSLQTDFTPIGSNQTNFDCESMIVSSDSIYLFTKEWISNYTTLYTLPKLPGSYIAHDIASYNVQGLITGATYLESQKAVVLVGYSTLLQPFFVLLYDFSDHHFFSGNKRKVGINLPFHQIEGIATIDGFNYFTSNEKFSQSIFNVPAKINQFNLSGLLSNYLDTNSVSISDDFTKALFQIFPNPSENQIQLLWLEDQTEINVEILNLTGQLIFEKKVSDPNNCILNIDYLPRGVYLIRINHRWIKKFIKV